MNHRALCGYQIGSRLFPGLNPEPNLSNHGNRANPIKKNETEPPFHSHTPSALRATPISSPSLLMSLLARPFDIPHTSQPMPAPRAWRPVACYWHGSPDTTPLFFSPQLPPPKSPPIHPKCLGFDNSSSDPAIRGGACLYRA